jgi:hypothetical protein
MAGLHASILGILAFMVSIDAALMSCGFIVVPEETASAEV